MARCSRSGRSSSGLCLRPAALTRLPSWLCSSATRNRTHLLIRHLRLPNDPWLPFSHYLRLAPRTSHVGRSGSNWSMESHGQRFQKDSEAGRSLGPYGCRRPRSCARPCRTLLRLRYGIYVIGVSLWMRFGEGKGRLKGPSTTPRIVPSRPKPVSGDGKKPWVDIHGAHTLPPSLSIGMAHASQSHEKMLTPKARAC